MIPSKYYCDADEDLKLWSFDKVALLIFGENDEYEIDVS